MSLIDPAGLRAKLTSRHLVVLDVRWSLGGPPGEGRYDAGHIPGARFCDLETALTGHPGSGGAGGRHPLPSTEDFEREMRTLGVSDHTQVVVYDEDGGFAAARLWWSLRYWGHQQVEFLDGGYRAWTEAGFPISTDVTAVPAGDFTARPGGMPVLDADSAASLAQEGVLLDARAAERYRGETEPIDPVAGHIPGAISASTADNDRPNGTYRPASELKARFAELGIDGTRPVGVYCGSGISAAHEVLALSVIGVPAALYVGSWSDWISDASRPIATGAEPG